MNFHTADDGHVYNDDKKPSGSHHGSVRPETGLKMKKEPEIDRSYSEQLLLKAPRGTKIYGMVLKVNPEGDSRQIKLLMVDNYGEITPVQIKDNRLDRNVKGQIGTYQVRGGGMDMIFDLVYNLGLLLHNDGYYFTKREVT